MFDSKHKKMMELIKGKRDSGVPLTFDEMAYEIGIPRREAKRKELQVNVQVGLLIFLYTVSLILSRSSPVISAFLGTVTLFVGLISVNLNDGKIDLNGIHKREGFGCGVYVIIAFFFPLYFGVYLGYQDQKFESFLLKNECSYIENESTEAEYYCSKPDKKITRSTYDYIQSNMGFNSESGVVFNSGWSK